MSGIQELSKTRKCGRIVRALVLALIPVYQMDFSRQAHVQILDHTCKNGQLLRLRTIVGFLTKLCSI